MQDPGGRFVSPDLATNAQHTPQAAVPSNTAESRNLPPSEDSDFGQHTCTCLRQILVASRNLHECQSAREHDPERFVEEIVRAFSACDVWFRCRASKSPLEIMGSLLLLLKILAMVQDQSVPKQDSNAQSDRQALLMRGIMLLAGLGTILHTDRSPGSSAMQALAQALHDKYRDTWTSC